MNTTHRRWRTSARAAFLTLLAVLLLLAAAASAWAAPAEPTLSLADLQTKLESGPLSGYMKTVVTGYTIEKIPVTVEGVVEESWGSLILAEATGPVIDKIGAVAGGMSGSPVYVNDGGVDKLIGALSYSGDFTIGGMFLASPIEYMAALETDYQVKPPVAGVYKLTEPVKTGSGVVGSVVVARSAKAAEQVDAKAGQIVMRPMGLIEIGGLAPQSRAYKELAAKLEKQTGLPVVAASGAGIWTGLPAPALEAGSSICQLFSLGAVWYGAAGTATYVNDGVAVAFGHPSSWSGPCGAAMTGGYVAGVWPSEWWPYKMINPRDVKGTITQDRNWGIAGVVGQDPDMIPVNAHVTFPEDGRDVTTDSWAAEWAFQTPGYESLPAELIMQALWDACDAWALPGSAETTATIVVSDDTGEHTVEMKNVWDSYDITWEPIWDLYDALWALAADPDGVLNTRLESIDYQATISSVRRSARLVDIVLPDSLHTGDNEVQLTYYGYGSRDLKTKTTTLTIPEGKPVNGEIDVVPASWSWWDDGSADDPAPDTLAQIVDRLNHRAKNSDLLLTFYPREEGGYSPPHDSSSPAVKSSGASDGVDTTLDPVEVTLHTDWVFQDMLAASTIPITLEARPARVDFGRSVMLSGTVQGVTSDVPVSIYRVDAATGTETPVETLTAVYENGTVMFETRARVAPHHTTFVARVAAFDDWLPGSADDTVKVRAALRLAADVNGRRVTLAAKVRPADTGGKVAFQRYSGGRWRTVKTDTVSATGGAGAQWRAPGAGTYRWRAKFLGSVLNSPETSAEARVVVR
jgi:hypothetical protein